MTPPPPSSTSSTFFTTNGGDIILRAGPDPDSKRDFRVHKVILSLASPVFEDMFGFPQPPDHTSNEQLPIVDIPEPPKVVDLILRLIYPGVEPPKITNLAILSVLFSATDKYNIASIYPVLKDALKTFLPLRPFGVYVVACRFGFSEEAKEAARLGNTRNIIYQGFDEEVQHISSIDLLRWVRFVQKREIQGRARIEELLDWGIQDEDTGCNHGDGGKTFYSNLERAVGDAFARNPSLGSKDLFAVLDTIPDPPPSCPPRSDSAEFCREYGEREMFDCPLFPMAVRNNLVEVAAELDTLNRTILNEAFGEGIGNS